MKILNKLKAKKKQAIYNFKAVKRQEIQANQSGTDTDPTSPVSTTWTHV